MKHLMSAWVLAMVGFVQAAAPEADQPGEITLFAFDDHAIPWQHNVKLTLVQAEKYAGNPVLTPGPDGAPDAGHAFIYGSVIRDGGKFRMWYLGMHERQIKRGNAPGWWRPMCYAESADGIHWTKPPLGLVEFNGNTANNICLIEGEPFSLTRVNDFLSVMLDPSDPDPSRRYKAAYIAHPLFDEVRGGRSRIGPNESRWCSFVTATSSDGLRWKVVGDRPVNAGGERFEVSGLYKFGDFYYAPGQLLSPWAWRADGREIGRTMMTYRSGDFEHWDSAKAMSFARPGQLTTPPVPGQQTHMGSGLWNRGNVMVGLYGMWQDGPKDRPKGSSHLYGVRIDLGLIVSDDGIHYREPIPDFKVIARGNEGEWDHFSLLQGHAFANVGDKTYIWYAHWDIEGQFRNQAIGLATLRRDGFGYLARHIADEDAHVITQNLPAAPHGYRIAVNVDGVNTTAPLTLELLDQRGRPIANLAAAKVDQSGVRQSAWAQAVGAGQPVALRITLPAGADARLYAVYAAPEP